MASIRSFFNRSSEAPSGSLPDIEGQKTADSGNKGSFLSALSRWTGTLTESNRRSTAVGNASNSKAHKPDIQLTTETEKQYDYFHLRWKSYDEMALSSLMAMAELGNQLGELKAQTHTDPASMRTRRANASALQRLTADNVVDQDAWRDLVENLEEELDLEGGQWKKPKPE